MSGEDDVDFSAITRAIKCGGSMVEQLLNGVHYGTSEVRCLLLDECDLIIECKVCRNLFRALPNFIAHKRVYCLEAFQDPNQVTLPLTQDSHNVDTVVVEPVAPETVNNQNVRGQVKTSRHQPTDTLANTIQQLQNGTFEGKSDAYKFYTDVADKVDRNAQGKQTHFMKHERIPGNPNAVSVSRVESARDEELTTEDVMSEEMVSISEEVLAESDTFSNANLQEEWNTAADKAFEKPEGVLRSARLRAKSEQHQLMQEKVKTPTKKETRSKVVNSVEDGHSLREKAKKMFLYPVRKTVTNAKDCDLKALKCLICRKKYASMKCLSYHMKSLHSSKRQVFPCPLCSTVLKHKWGLTRHLMRTHGLSKNQVDKMKEDLMKLHVTTEESNKTPESTEKQQSLSAKKDKIQDNKKNSSIKNSSLANISSQGRTRSNSALEKKAKLLVDSAKADSMPKSGKKCHGESVEKKEFSVKFCSRTNSKSAQFYSGLTLLHCKMCSKAFAKKESLLAHSRGCSLAVKEVTNRDSLPQRQMVNRRQRLGPSKVEQYDTLQKFDTVKLGQGAQPNGTVTNSSTAANGTSEDQTEPMSTEAERDIFITSIGRISPVKVVLEHCDVSKQPKGDIEVETPKRRAMQQLSLENEVDKILPIHSDDTLTEDQKSTNINKEKSACVLESKTIDSSETRSPMKDKLTPSSRKAEEEPQIFPTSLRTSQRQRALNHQVSDSKMDGINKGFKNSATDFVRQNRTLPKRQATKSQKRTLSEGSAEQVSELNTSVGTSADLDSSDNGQDTEVSFISDDELMDMQKRLEAQLGQQITEVSKELMGKLTQSGPAVETVRSVEEIWVSKSPGKPAEKLKSNRMYVVDSSDNKRGRPYCQDSRRVDLLIDEKTLKCLECGELFGSVSNMRRHAIRHLGWQRYRCKLCSSYCSYHKSEMKSHLVRVHGSLVSPFGDSFLKFCMIDLGKEGSRLRAQKRQRTMSNRQAARATTSSASLKEGLQSNDGSTDDQQSDRKKPAINLNNIVDPDPKRFNISTRKSPRVFDIRPVKRADNMQTLITRKRSYPKRGTQLTAAAGSNPDQPETEPPSTCSISSEEPRAPTATVVTKSKTRSIDFRKTRSVDNPWVDGFYKRLSGGSLGALRKEQMMIRPFKNRKGETVLTGSSSSSSISNDNVNSKYLPGNSVDKNSLRQTKSDSSLQSLTTSPCTNLTVISQNE